MSAEILVKTLSSWNSYSSVLQYFSKVIINITHFPHPCCHFLIYKAVKTQEKEVNCTSRADQENEQKSDIDQKSGTSSSSQEKEEKRGSVRGSVR